MPKSRQNGDQHELLPANGHGAGGYSNIIDRAVASGAAPEVIDKLLTIQLRWEANENRKSYDRARAAATPELIALKITKNKPVALTEGGKPAYWHEDLVDLKEACDPILAKHGLTSFWRTEDLPNNWVRVTCVLRHEDGHEETSTLAGPHDPSGKKNAPQAIVSTTSYLKRDTYKSVTGVVAGRRDDDDAKHGVKVGDQPISEEQVKALQTLIKDGHADLGKVLQYAAVERLESIPQRDYARVDLELRRHKAKVTAPVS